MLNLSGVSLDPRARQKTVNDIKSLLKTFNAGIPESADKSQTFNKMEVSEIPHPFYILAWGGGDFLNCIPFLKNA